MKTPRAKNKQINTNFKVTLLLGLEMGGGTVIRENRRVGDGGQCAGPAEA